MCAKGYRYGFVLLALLVGVVACKDDGGGTTNTGGSGAGKTTPSGPMPLVDVPFIFWGGDVATFVANGGLDTKSGSIFGAHGLKCHLTPGDDFDKQIENYRANKCPLLRGTFSMLGQASETLTEKPEAMPVVFLQLTWSAGDHLVGRDTLTRVAGGDSRTPLEQLKGKKIAIQKGGPHVGMLNDILQTAGLTWKDITVAWTKDVSGPDGPAALFRKDASVDACFAISPEKDELTSSDGGVDSVGDGTKNSIKGAHVVVSTAQMSRSIADVYACRKDFYDKNRAWIDNFVAGYLKACEELTDVKKRAANKDKAAEGRYKEYINLAQSIWGKDPAFKEQVAKEDDVAGLISDATFVGLPGNETFFKAKGNLSGFDFKQKQALRLPADPSKEPLKTNPTLFQAADLDYAALRRLGDLHGRLPTQGRIRAEAEIEREQTIYSFEISFQPDQSEFSAAQYGDAFQRALELASLYGNMAVAIRGHADPCLFVQRFLVAAGDCELIKKKAGQYVVLPDEKPFDPTKMDQVLDFLKKHPEIKPKATGPSPADFVSGLLDLSTKRSEAVRKAVLEYAAQKNLVLDESQFRAKGVGVAEPKAIIVDEDAGYDANRRVEFSIIKVPLKDVSGDEFDL